MIKDIHTVYQPILTYHPFTRYQGTFLTELLFYDQSFLFKKYIFSCDQAALWMVFSVCLSVCHTFLKAFRLFSHHCIIMKFSGVIKNDQSNVHAKGQGQRSKVKVTEVNTQFNRFWTVTTVWIHTWCWNDAYSLMMIRRGALLFFKVIHQISRSHGSKLVAFDPDWTVTPVWIHQWLRNDTQSLK